MHIRDAREFYVMGKFSGTASSLEVPSSVAHIFGNSSLSQVQPRDTYEDINEYEEWLEIDESGHWFKIGIKPAFTEYFS